MDVLDLEPESEPPESVAELGEVLARARDVDGRDPVPYLDRELDRGSRLPRGEQDQGLGRLELDDSPSFAALEDRQRREVVGRAHLRTTPNPASSPSPGIAASTLKSASEWAVETSSIQTPSGSVIDSRVRAMCVHETFTFGGEYAVVSSARRSAVAVASAACSPTSASD